ncbi:MAG: hypothetical protein ACIAQZ_12260 [Sedimentisphaeraceae bacterium JB056]
MKTFTDNTGKSWSITINVAAVKRLKDLQDINLLDAAGRDLLERLSEDPILLCDCLYVLCKNEAEAESISDEDFGARLGGDSLDNATSAFLEELVDFFPKQKRVVLAKILTKVKMAETLAADLATKKLEAPELDGQIEKILKDSFDSATSSLPSPG